VGYRPHPKLFSVVIERHPNPAIDPEFQMNYDGLTGSSLDIDAPGIERLRDNRQE
jgi:hypothetical protein